ncbi:hypothetical protein [Kitasatospora sp. NPDC050543]|uniref:hypothetical protein n=1 Tax=Kitasatospora sp. NPDC050543 TaxID=3364054 RepID=UPI0037B40CD9
MGRPAPIAGVPARYVAASGAGLGDKGDELEQLRATLAPVITRNPYLKVSAKVAGDHGSIRRKDFRAVAVAVAVRETAAGREPAAHDPEVC